ncbi:MAG: MFS transporter [Steroidobacteraceae bacterium]
MNPTTLPVTAQVAQLPARLSPVASFFLMASLIVTFLAGASAPTSLYPHYQAQWGFSSLTITVIFAVYALAVLAALLVFGRLSDHVGRRPVLLVSVVVQLISLTMFATADGLGALLFARTLQGISAGAAIAAVGAGLLDLDKRRGPVANAVATPLGTALGGVAGGIFVGMLPAPHQLVFVVLSLLVLIQGVGLLWMAETTERRSGAMASLRPQLSLSAATRGPLLRAVPIIIATWAIPGFFSSLGPAFVRSMTGENSALLSGLALFVMAGSAGTAGLVLRHLTPQAAMRTGGVALAIGMVVVLSALYLHSPLLFFAGLSGTGVGFGTGFQGAVRSVVSHAQADERAAVLAVIFVIAYLAMGVPAIAAGLLLTGSALPSVAAEFGGVILLLAALSLVMPRIQWSTGSPR